LGLKSRLTAAKQEEKAKVSLRCGTAKSTELVNSFISGEEGQEAVPIQEEEVTNG
jgi:hypothetical protein